MPVFINFKKKKTVLLFFTHASEIKLALIIIVQRLHSFITYVWCSTSLSVLELKFNKREF